jgi:hypothetical protein
MKDQKQIYPHTSLSVREESAKAWLSWHTLNAVVKMIRGKARSWGASDLEKIHPEDARLEDGREDSFRFIIREVCSCYFPLI